jgi:integrative and conjugative element protein (TIGR02256 family)
MTESYHRLPNLEEVSSYELLTISRAKDIVNAIDQWCDGKLIKLLKHSVGDKTELECIIFDIKCDEVPHKNAFGIKSLERIALVVPENNKRLVEVLVLRKSFPTLIHQNNGNPDAPASLCLYFESSNAVMRTWTAESFLHRIQWWLEKSSRGELHPADQPVENLFYASPYELVLPWNFAELKTDNANQFVITQGLERPDKGVTYSLQVVSKNSQPKMATVKPIEVTLPAVVQGFVEHDPTTLKQLVDLLSRRNIDFISTLRAEIKLLVDSSGASENNQNKVTIILLHTPMCRTEGAEPDVINRRAFVLLISTLDLGVAIGALFKQKNLYYNDVFNTLTETHWETQTVFPMSVMNQNDARLARRQSGIVDEGPTGVLIGAGSLGSALLNLWGRSGWGKWTVIDNDHIKPHNLSRHTAYAQHIGQAKTLVAVELQAAVMDGALEVTALNEDATNFSLQSVKDALTESKLVVDASTTLDYPRGASKFDSFTRHISVFLTPNGNAGVLLAEDSKRLFRLRTLEAQYYRAIIQEDWGRDHLAANANTFWSGSSCRDISVVMPYSRIMGQASTLAEQIPIAASSNDASVRIWQRDPCTGTVEIHDVTVASERNMRLGDRDLFIDAGVEQQLRYLRTKGFPNETGGVLLGYYDFNINAIVIVAGLAAPSDSKASPNSFERGVKGLSEAVNEAAKRTAGNVRYIGEWHSHPPGHSASPSSDDVIQLAYLAKGMAEDGLPAVQLIVGEHDLQVLQGIAKAIN